MSQPTIIDVMHDPHLFGPWFKNTKQWLAWSAFLKSVFALPMSTREIHIFRKFTRRESPPSKPARECYGIIGRRGGKTFIASFVVVYLACFRDYREYLGPGERAVVMLIAQDRRQARVAKDYVSGFMKNIPMLRNLVLKETSESIELRNNINIEVHTASFRSTRGYTIPVCVCDETSFWWSDPSSSNPDREIVNAIRPGMATIPGSLLLCISSPYSRQGVMWEAFQKYYGRDSDVLVWRADTRSMNPSVPQSVIARAYEEDPIVAEAEYGGHFRRDLETFINREVVEACLASGCYERGPISGVHYTAFCDPSGGSGTDSMTLAIAHNDGARRVLDVVRERRPPFSPESVCEEFCQLLKVYKVSTVFGDRFAGQWPREQFRKHGITYKVADRTKSEIYRDLLPLLNSGRIQLLDHKKLINQLVSLERRTRSGGRDVIDHAARGHDDVINAAAGALVYLGERRSRIIGGARVIQSVGYEISDLVVGM